MGCLNPLLSLRLVAVLRVLIAVRHLEAWASHQVAQYAHLWSLHWVSKTYSQSGHAHHGPTYPLAGHHEADRRGEGRAACWKSRHTSSQVVVDTERRVNVGIGRRDKDIAIVVEDSRDYAKALNVADMEVGCSHRGCRVAA